MGEIEDLVEKFTEADNAIKTVFQMANPLLVVQLIFDEKEKRIRIYTLESTLKKGQNLEEVRDTVLQVTGMIPSFYLEGTKLIVNHRLNLALLKRINDLDYVVKIKGSPYSAGGSTDF